MTSMFAEMGARRRRLRAQLGDRGQALVEFGVLSGLALGSLGLFVRPWMAAAAPWGFSVPAIFLAGYVLLEVRRQAVSLQTPGVDEAEGRHDWPTLLWSFGCALVGAAAFVIAWTSEPAAAPEEDVWTPPESSVPVDISP